MVGFALALLALPACKQAAKKAAKELAEESTEQLAKRGGKELASEMSERLARVTDWDGLVKLLRREGLVDEGLAGLSRPFGKKILKSAKEDYRFFTALKELRTLADEYTIFTKDAPRLSEDIAFFRLFARAKHGAGLAKQTCFLDNIAAKEQNSVVQLLNKKTGSLLADYSDGIVRLAKAERILPEEHLLKMELLPNALYKMRGADGLHFSVSVDKLGRLQTVEAQHISPDELVANVLGKKGKIDLGREWKAAFRKLKQVSKGRDVNATVIVKYAGEGATPQSVRIEATVRGKKFVNSWFRNVYSGAENEALVKRFAKLHGMPIEKQNKLLLEMAEDAELSKLVHADGKNIERWLKTRNHVDKSLLARTPKGQLPKNGRVYAGNVYYFHPSLNTGLKARLERGGGVADLRGIGKLSLDDLVLLDKKFPDGVPFTQRGFPDFSHVAAKGKDGKAIVVDIGVLSGSSQKDISAAETIFQQAGNKWARGFTWHHIEGATKLMRVPTDIHQLVDHTGGMSMADLN